jgi:radical SAM superfamily enzyme YgiQ (UPF0313 family)
MPDIVLTTLNAKYIHAAFGLRYLLANLGELQSRACIREFDINQRPLDIVESLLSQDPRIIGFGVYIWNVAATTEVVAAIRKIRPETTIVLGGPEVSHEVEDQPVVQLADHVITGEADLKFSEVCRTLLGEGRPEPSAAGPLPRVISAELPEFSRIVLPYDLYTDEDIAHRVVYVEASRGCPFTCEFCLSSLDIPVRQVPLPALLEHLQRLLDRGLRHFKFVDRTFNLNPGTSSAILNFFLARYQPGQFFHFEMIPDRLPGSLREVIAKFPAGALQFEVGVQTFNEQVAALIQRRQNYQRLEDNFCFLRNDTGVYIHADLIVGLPGETLPSFAAGFDRLISLQPQEIQVGLLKRLRGTPICHHDTAWQMVYNPNAPYEILQNKLIDFETMQRLRRFARYWDLIGNSGNFIESTPMLWKTPSPVTPRASDSTDESEVNYSARPSPFFAFLRFSDWLHARTGRTDSIALARLAELFFEFLTNELRFGAGPVAEALWRDYQRGGRHDQPDFLRRFLPVAERRPRLSGNKSLLPKRQARHLV